MRNVARCCKLLAVFLYGALPSAPTLSCQDKDERSTSRVVVIIVYHLHSDRDGHWLALGLLVGKAAYEAVQVAALAEVLPLSF